MTSAADATTPTGSIETAHATAPLPAAATTAGERPLSAPATTAASAVATTAVLLLHGIGGGAAMWASDAAGTVDALAAAGFRVVAVDLPGYGAAEGAATVDLDAFVAAVAARVDAERARGAVRCVLLGHSMGGMVALEVVARGVAAVDGLVLACTTAAFGPADGDWQRRFVADRLAPLDAGRGMAAMAAQLVPAMVSPRTRPGAAEVASSVMARVPEATYRAALAAIVAFDRRAALGAMAVPTLVVAGDADAVAPSMTMRRMAARIPDAEFVVVDDAGHLAPVEQPAAFNAAVVDFVLRRVAARAPSFTAATPAAAADRAPSH